MRQLSVRFKDGMIKAGGVVLSTGTGAAAGYMAAEKFNAPTPVKYVAAGAGAVLGFGIAMGGPKFAGYAATLAFGLGLGGVLLFANPQVPDNQQGGDSAIIQPADPDGTKNDIINHYHYYYNTYTCDENCPCRDNTTNKTDDKTTDNKTTGDKTTDDKTTTEETTKPGIDIEQVTPGTETTEEETTTEETTTPPVTEETTTEETTTPPVTEETTTPPVTEEKKLTEISINGPEIPREPAR